MRTAPSWSSRPHGRHSFASAPPRTSPESAGPRPSPASSSRARTHHAGAGGAPAALRRRNQPRDRRESRPQRQDGGPTREQHVRQARRLLTSCGHDLRPRASTDLIREWVISPTRSGLRIWVVQPMCARRPRRSFDVMEDVGSESASAGSLSSGQALPGSPRPWPSRTPGWRRWFWIGPTRWPQRGVHATTGCVSTPGAASHICPTGRSRRAPRPSPFGTS